MSIKETLNLAVGKAAAFLGDQKEKASEYLEEKRELYETKAALDEANQRLDDLFNELGRVCFYGKSTVPGRDKADIKNDIKLALDTAEALQARYDELSAVNAE